MFKAVCLCSHENYRPKPITMTCDYCGSWISKEEFEEVKTKSNEGGENDTQAKNDN